MFICKPNINLIPNNSLHRYYALKNLAIWLTKNILGNNSRQILPEIRCAMERQVSKELSFCIDFRQNAKYPITELYLPKFGQNEFSTKIGLHHVLASTQKIR